MVTWVSRFHILPWTNIYTEYMATYGAIPSDRNPKTSWVTLTDKINEKYPHKKWCLVQREKIETPISQSFLVRCLLAYFKICSPSIWVPFSMYLDANWDPPIWDTARSWHTLICWKSLKQRRQLGQSRRFKRKPKGWDELNVKLHLLYEPLRQDWKG